MITFQKDSSVEHWYRMWMDDQEIGHVDIYNLSKGEFKVQFYSKYQLDYNSSMKVLREVVEYFRIQRTAIIKINKE
jgi:hypothetical protein